MITRFAPSPTGYLHWGHARAAFEAFDAARRHNGQCFLRIEDIDHTRCRPHFTQAIYEDLSWLGFSWPSPVRVQSNHIKDYLNIFETLKTRGIIYPCVKTRSQVKTEIERRGLSFYKKDMTEPFPDDGPAMAWRLSMAACRDWLGNRFDNLSYHEQAETGSLTTCSVRPDRFGDIIIARKDIGLSYHMAVTHDDALQGITHVIRGEDLKDQTDLHVLLQNLMDWPVPIYRHHRLIMRADGQKLAKRNNDPSIKAARDAGREPDEIWANVLKT